MRDQGEKSRLVTRAAFYLKGGQRMLSNADRFGHFDIRFFDTARFPLERLGNPEVYNSKEALRI